MLLALRSIPVPVSWKEYSNYSIWDSSLSYNPNYWQDIFIQIIDQLNELK
jgi:hypothetical protein